MNLTQTFLIETPVPLVYTPWLWKELLTLPSTEWIGFQSQIRYEKISQIQKQQIKQNAWDKSSFNFLNPAPS